MNNNTIVSVREIQNKDIDLLVDYWFNADSEFLKSMGADKDKLPTRNSFVQMLKKQISLPIQDKKSYALIWEIDGKQVGHSNVNNILYGKEATMHLHLWNLESRKKGVGTKLLQRSLRFYFEKLELDKLICEPYAFNPAPNKTLEKLGFEFVKKYRTIPGSLNFEQEVKRWEMTVENYAFAGLI